MTLIDPPAAALQGERVVLRKSCAGDVDAIVELLSDPDVRRYLGGPADAEAVRADFLHVMSRPRVPTPGRFVITDVDTDEMLGMVSLEPREPERPGHVLPDGNELEVSYSLRRAWWGVGLASEAVTVLCRAFSGICEDQPVLLVTQSANAPSVRLAERLGFAFVANVEEFDAEQWLGVASLHEVGRNWDASSLPAEA